LLRAISLIPERPEAYFLLSQLYERAKDWQEAYSFAVMGQRLGENHPKLRTNVEYPGKYALIYEQAISAWWIGLFDESLHLFRQLSKDTTMLPIHTLSVKNNLQNLAGTVSRKRLTYCGSMHDRLRSKFSDSQIIEQNYSEAWQDMFVLTMLNGKRNGTFFEIGCGDPVLSSNTKLLEEWGWTGISIDANPELTAKFAKTRGSTVITGDATALNYEKLIQKDYDYLQIDVDPAMNSLNTLLRIPFDKCRFAVITFEHDDYQSSGIKERSRQYLLSHGYTMVVGDIAPNRYDSFEDWWVHPDLVDPKIVAKMRDNREGTKKADCYMLGD
jgi:SAM-dependent methyltransferase